MAAVRSVDGKKIVSIVNNKDAHAFIVIVLVPALTSLTSV